MAHFLQAFPKRRDFAEGRVAIPSSNAPGRQASKIRFVFPKRRSSRLSEHCQGGGGGRRGHYLDKRSGAVQCQRQTRSTHGWQQLPPRFWRHCPTFCVCLPYEKSHGNQFPNLFRKAVSIKPVASARRQASPPFPMSKPCPTGDRILSKAVRSASSETHKLAYSNLLSR